MGKKLSVIVPVYNTEKYLKRCLDSIINQTYYPIEIIAVDDGSTDNSLNILQQYATKYNRMKIVKCGRGVSAARNTGILNATGEYIGFVDSDDWIDLDMYEKLIDELESNSADLVTCGFLPLYSTDISNDIIEKKKQIKAGEIKVCDKSEAIDIILQGKIAQVSPCNKLYKKTLFNYLSYPEGKYHEDTYIIVDLLMKCDKVVIDPNVRYYYYHRDSSIITGAFSMCDYDLVVASDHNYKLVSSNFPNAMPAAQMRVFWSHFWVLDKAILSESSTLRSQTIEKEIAYLRKHYKEIISNQYLEPNRIRAMRILKLSYPLYRVLVIERQRRKVPNA